MKVMYIGGPDNFGEAVIAKLQADWFSRSNGYNIDDKQVRLTLAAKSIEYDAVILHAYSLVDGQNALLRDVCRTWMSNNHKGHIIVTGSIVTHNPDFSKDDPKNWVYAAQKSFTDKLCQMMSKKCTEGKYKFKTTIIKPGALDSHTSRSRPGFTKGLQGSVFADTIAFILNLPNDVHVPEIVLDITYD